MRESIAALMRSFDDGRERAEFYRMWRLGVRAGLAHPAILEKLGPFTGVTREIHGSLLAATRARHDIAWVVQRRRTLFEPFEAALLVMGEESGRLDPVLAALADFFERQYRMMLVVKKRVAYPLVMSLAAIWIAPLPLVFSGRAWLYAVLVLGGTGWWAAAGAGILAGRAQAYQRKPRFVRARFARTLAMTIEAGLPLGRALRLAADASGDPALRAHLASRDEHALSSTSLAETLADAPGLPPEFHAAIGVAEATGDVRTTLGRLAELYEDGFR